MLLKLLTVMEGTVLSRWDLEHHRLDAVDIRTVEAVRGHFHYETNVLWHR